MLALVAPCCHARSITVGGKVLLEDGQPVSGGTVVLTEYTGPAGRMPDARRLAAVKTDADGSFHATPIDVRGSVDVGLERKRCEWSWASQILSWKDVKASDHFAITLNTRHDACERRDGP